MERAVDNHVISEEQQWSRDHEISRTFDKGVQSQENQQVQKNVKNYGSKSAWHYTYKNTYV